MAIRVLIVDDSSFFRQFLEKALSGDPSIDVVGTASDGEEALEKVRALRPDLVTMDISMPQMGGLQATELIMAYNPVPIIVISAWVDGDHNDNAFRALAAGALEIVEKPARKGGPDLDTFVGELSAKIKVLSRIKVIRHIKGKLEGSPARRGNRRAGYRVVAVGGSTGGPEALQNLLRRLPQDFAAAILLVQHITSGFTEGFVRWLNNSTPLAVRMAAPGDRVAPGTVLVGPEQRHFLVGDSGVVRLDSSSRGMTHQPSADVLFESVAGVYGSEAVGVLLTGMGADGARGLKAMRDAGGRTIVQDESSCVVFGMPKVAIELGGAEQVLALEDIPETLLSLTERGSGGR